MPNPYTTTDLLASLKLRGFVPSTSTPGGGATSDFLRILNEELQTFIVETLFEVNEELLVATDPLDHTIVSGTAAYALPERAIGPGLRDVLISDGNGGYRQLDRIEPEREGDYGVTGGVSGYKLEGNNVVLIPTPTSASGTLRLKYYARPNRLVETSDCAEIQDINTATKTVTFTANAPADFTLTHTYDVVKGKPHFDTLADDITLVDLVTTTATFSTLPTGLAVGDFLCFAGESPIPQIPVQMHSVLAHKAAAIYHQATGNLAKAQMAEATCEAKKAAAIKLLKPRVKGSSRIIINRNGPGMGTRGWRR